MEISISAELKTKCPGMALGTIVCDVVNTPINELLWKDIKQLGNEIRENYQLDTITSQKQIAATRKVYLACGKKPGRYRPSSEALMRRTVKGEDLYQINTLVDLVNMISLKTGYSIGGFDANVVVGKVEAGVGREGEPYEGIGRGVFNIHNLPVLRDEKSAIGTPTSDEVRTALQLETTRFYMNINGYTGAEDLKPAMEYSVELLKKYVSASNFYTTIIE